MKTINKQFFKRIFLFLSLIGAITILTTCFLLNSFNFKHESNARTIVTAQNLTHTIIPSDNVNAFIDLTNSSKAKITIDKLQINMKDVAMPSDYKVFAAATCDLTDPDVAQLDLKFIAEDVNDETNKQILNYNKCDLPDKYFDPNTGFGIGGSINDDKTIRLFFENIIFENLNLNTNYVLKAKIDLLSVAKVPAIVPAYQMVNSSNPYTIANIATTPYTQTPGAIQKPSDPELNFSTEKISDTSVKIKYTPTTPNDVPIGYTYVIDSMNVIYNETKANIYETITLDKVGDSFEKTLTNLDKNATYEFSGATIEYSLIDSSSNKIPYTINIDFTSNPPIGGNSFVPSELGTTSIALIVGLTGGVVALLLIASGGFLYYKKNHLKLKNSINDSKTKK